MIVDADVINDVNETAEFLPSLDRVEEMLGTRPEKALTDAGNNSGAVLEGLEELWPHRPFANRSHLKPGAAKLYADFVRSRAVAAGYSQNSHELGYAWGR